MDRVKWKVKLRKLRLAVRAWLPAMQFVAAVAVFLKAFRE